MNHLPSVMSHSFSQVPKVEIPRSTFNRSFGRKQTFDAGYLVPFFVDEALPGDTFNVKMSAICRLSTPIKPLMDNLFMETFFFAVPNRLVWSNWQKFNGEQLNPGDSTDYVVPTMTSTAGTGYLVSTIHDYLGLPIQVPGLVHSCLFHRAYNLIYNEWFRDENLCTRAIQNIGDGPDAPTDYALLKRGKRHDYFTSCLPWPQKGNSVLLPLGTTAPVIGIGKDNQVFASAGAAIWETNKTSTTTYPNSAVIDPGNANNVFRVLGSAATGGTPQIYADLSSATAATINQIRQAFQIQRLYERDARGGTRYTEILRSHFGVTSPDQRLQRPEYLGGGSTTINITPVSQMSATGGVTPQGNLAGFGVAHVNGHGFTKSFVEHCLLIGLVCVRADLTYQQGLPRMFSRSTRWDYYWPALSHIGEQAVLNKEIYAQGSANPTQDAAVFGYQERFAEYRYKQSEICGVFRSVYGTPLDMWHLSQKFASLPVLNATFINEAPPMSRVVAVATEPNLFFDSYIDMKCARPMPVYGVPGMVDHF